jgi:cytochrome oxidase Cu insertion factor (SCO1/SenC/PrrC family)
LSLRSRLALLATALLAAAPATGRASEAPGEPEPLYELPAAGSYALPPIDRVSEHVLLGSDGREAPLLELGPGRFAIVAFVYLGCHDAAGCPLLLASLQQTDRRLTASPELRGRVRLVTVSFDPSRDGPAEMAGLRRALAPRGDWRFFTSRDEAALRPVRGFRPGRARAGARRRGRERSAPRGEGVPGRRRGQDPQRLRQRLPRCAHPGA